MSTRRWILGGSITLGGLILLSCVGIPLLEILVYFLVIYPGMLLVGWVWFLQRVLPTVRFDGAGLVVAVIATAVLSITLDRQLRRWRSRRGECWHTRQTLAIVIAGISVCLSGICLVGMVHELQWIARADEPVARWSIGRGPFRRAFSKNNLKQIGLALLNYHDIANTFPSGGTFNPRGKAQHSWMTAILPWVDRATLYSEIDLTQPWNDPSNRSAFETFIQGYQPAPDSREPPSRDGYATTGYAANGLVMGGGFGMSIRDFADGTSTTLMAGEARGNFKPWGNPTNWRDASLGINKSPEGFGSPFANGALFLMGDGSVRFISETIDPKVLQGLATPAGGETDLEF